MPSSDDGDLLRREIQQTRSRQSIDMRCSGPLDDSRGCARLAPSASVFLRLLRVGVWQSSWLGAAAVVSGCSAVRWLLRAIESPPLQCARRGDDCVCDGSRRAERSGTGREETDTRPTVASRRDGRVNA